MTNDTENITERIEISGERLDKYLSEHFKDLSRSYIQKLIKDKCILIDGKEVKAKEKTIENSILTIELPEPQIPENLQAENIPLDILYEDNDIIVINKPKNMVVHPAAGHYTGTIVNALLYHCKDNLSGINGILRPGIVHRIDKNTTGVIVACKNDFSHNAIAQQLKVHSINRTYVAIVHNSFSEEEGTVNAPIGRSTNDRKKMAINYKNGREAITHYKVLDRLNGKYNYIECKLETGRTHQIRVHMTSIHHPLLGDDVYGNIKNEPFKCEGQTLHARTLGFIHPTTNKYMEFEAPIPDYFQKIINSLKR